MSTINPSDQFLVQRGTNSYKQRADSLMSTINADTAPYDYLLIQRGTDSYKVSAKDVKDQLGGSSSAFSQVLISPLSITPTPSEQTITATTDIPKVDGNVPADVIYTWYVYDAATGDAGKTELKSTTNRNSVDTLTLPASAAGKFIGCSVTYLAVTIDEDQRCSVGLPAGPVADMRSLRFDRDRLTRFTRTTDSSIGKTFTFSTWIKPTAVTEPNRLFTIYDISSTTYSLARIKSDYTIQCYLNSNGSSQPTTTQALNENEWNHLVVTVNNGQWNVVINGGAPQDMGTSTNSNNAGGTFGLGGFEESSNNNEVIDGYLSDAYFVDGAALEPTAFGKKFAEGWGPLDGSQVKANIGNAKVQPYDSRANTSQVWSNVYSFSAPNSGVDLANFFDGSITSKTSSNGDATLNFTGGLAYSKSVKVYSNSGRGGTNEDQRWTLNSNPPVLTVGGWTTLATGSGTINTIRAENLINSSIFEWNAIKVDDRLLVNNGLWNISQNWSDLVVGNATTSNPISKAFDGQEQEGCIPAYGSVMRLIVPSITSGTIKITGYRADVGSSLSINNVAQPTTANAYFEVEETISSELNIRWTSQSSTDYFRIDTISVNDEILVDPGAQWNTSQVWTNSFTCDKQMNPGVSLSNAFDGDLTSWTEEQVGSAVYTFVAPIAGNYRIYMFTNGQRPIKVDSTTVLTVPTDTIIKWYDIGAITVGQTITVDGEGQAGGGFIAAWEVNGELLVDPAPFGNNGFYLPFDPKATGENWSQFVTGTATDPRKGFDGSNAEVEAENTSTPIVFTPNLGTGSFEVIVVVNDTGNPAGNTITIDGTNLTPGTAGAFREFTGTVSSFNELTIESTGKANFRSITVDDKLLLDHSSIGVDDSGNDNHFQSEGFVIPSPVAPVAHRYWAIALERSINAHAPRSSEYNMYTSDGVRLVISKSFDQNCADQGRILGVDNNLIDNYQEIDGKSGIVFDATIPVAIIDAGGYNCYTVEGRSAVFSLNWSDDNVNWNKVYESEVSSGTGLCGYYTMTGVIGGGTLDTVIDTPMNNYAVLDPDTSERPTANGNLLGNNAGGFSQFGNTAIPDTGKYYFETTAGDTHLNVGLSKIHTGNVYGSTNSVLYSGAAGVRNIDGTSLDVPYGDKFYVGDIVGAVCDSDLNTIYFTVNGKRQPLLSHQTGGLFPAYGNGAPGSNVFFTANFGQQSFGFATDNGNGTVTLKDTSPNMDEKWSDNATGGWNSSYPAVNAFDGSLDTEAGPTSSGSTDYRATVEFDTALSVSSLRIYMSCSGIDNLSAGTKSILEIDDVNVHDIAISGGLTGDNGWVSFPGITSIKKLTIGNKAHGGTSTTNYVRAVEVDGHILLDGPGDTSQVWSDGITGTATTNNVLNMFDGTIATSSQFKTGQTVVFTPKTPINSSTSIETYVYYSGNVSVDGKANVDANADAWVTLSTGAKTLNNITFVPADSGKAVWVYGIRVDGKVLVNGPDTTVYSKLYQPWSEWVSELKNARIEQDEERISYLEQVIIEQSVPFERQTTYAKGSIVDMGGELFEAQVDNADVTASDFVLRLLKDGSNEWMKLDIKTQRRPPLLKK